MKFFELVYFITCDESNSIYFAADDDYTKEQFVSYYNEFFEKHSSGSAQDVANFMRKKDGLTILDTSLTINCNGKGRFLEFKGQYNDEANDDIKFFALHSHYNSYVENTYYVATKEKDTLNDFIDKYNQVIKKYNKELQMTSDEICEMIEKEFEGYYAVEENIAFSIGEGKDGLFHKYCK